MKKHREKLIFVLMMAITATVLLAPISFAWQNLPLSDRLDGQNRESYQTPQEGISHFKKHLPMMVDLSQKIKIMLTVLVVVMLYIVMRFLFYRFMVHQLDTRPQTALAIHYSIFFLLSFVCVVLMFAESFYYYMVYILGSAWLVLTILVAAML